MKTILLYSTFILLFAVNLIAQENKTSGKISGYMFGDYYKIIENHRGAIKDQHGFWFRRIYLTYNYSINSNFSTRLRFEMANSGDFESKEKMSATVKDAYLKYKYESAQIILGLQSPPTFAVIEKVWGYRSVEKTPMDLYKMASSRDFGLAVKGKFGSDSKFKYHVMFGNGSSNKQEIDKGKTGMISLGYYPANDLIVEVYSDYADHNSDSDWYTLQGFLGYNSSSLKAGLQYTHQNRDVNDGEAYQLRVVSAFASGKVSEQISLLGRVDRLFDPNPAGEKIAYLPFDKSAASTFIVAGLDWHPIGDVSFIPNIEYAFYDENDDGVTPSDDLVGRFTFYWNFY